MADFSHLAFFCNKIIKVCQIFFGFAAKSVIHCYRLQFYNVIVYNLESNNCCYDYILFTKLPWPGDSERAFWSSSQATTYPFVYHTVRRRLTLSLLVCDNFIRIRLLIKYRNDLNSKSKQSKQSKHLFSNIMFTTALPILSETSRSNFHVPKLSHRFSKILSLLYQLVSSNNSTSQ